MGDMIAVWCGMDALTPVLIQTSKKKTMRYRERRGSRVAMSLSRPARNVRSTLRRSRVKSTFDASARTGQARHLHSADARRTRGFLPLSASANAFLVVTCSHHSRNSISHSVQLRSFLVRDHIPPHRTSYPCYYRHFHEHHVLLGTPTQQCTPEPECIT